MTTPTLHLDLEATSKDATGSRDQRVLHRRGEGGGRMFHRQVSADLSFSYSHSIVVTDTATLRIVQLLYFQVQIGHHVRCDAQRQPVKGNPGGGRLSMQMTGSELETR